MSKSIKIEWTTFQLDLVIAIFREVVMPTKFGSIDERVNASIFYDLEEKLEKKHLSLNYKKKKKTFSITLKYHETAVLSRYLMKYGHICPSDTRIVLAAFVQTLQQKIQ